MEISLLIIKDILFTLILDSFSIYPLEETWNLKVLNLSSQGIFHKYELNREYINIMGGHHNTEAFNYYVDLTIKGFLEIRHYQEHIYNVTRIMATTGLKCFRPKSLQV